MGVTGRRMPEMIAGDLTEAASYVISNTSEGAAVASL